MKCPGKRLSGSGWRRIYEIVNQCGRFSPKRIARRIAAQSRRKGHNAFL